MSEAEAEKPNANAQTVEQIGHAMGGVPYSFDFTEDQDYRP